MTCCRGTGILSYKIIPAKEVRNTPLAGGLPRWNRIGKATPVMKKPEKQNRQIEAVKSPPFNHGILANHSLKCMTSWSTICQNDTIVVYFKGRYDTKHQPLPEP
jgi:hypothetical protein